MIGENASSAIGNLSQQPEHPVVMGTSEQGRRLDRLAPLIHELIAWDLVRRTESGTFVLSDDVQQRLQEVSAQQPRSSAQVYVGRLCERCGVLGVTRLVDGVRTCSACSRAMSTSATPEPPTELPHGRGRHGTRSRWHRKAG